MSNGIDIWERKDNPLVRVDPKTVEADIRNIFGKYAFKIPDYYKERKL
jgi:hypothetical protein